MVRAPLMQLSDIALAFGGNTLFESVTLAVQPGDRIALVGRNGSGKSMLLKVMAGLVEPDRGARAVPAGASVGYLEQEPDLSGHATLGDWAAAALPPEEAYRVEKAAEGLGLRADAGIAEASGGERRRAALVRCLAAEPDLLLLDEPTNHLDIAAIRWLEAKLSVAKGAVVVVSHDRAFLEALTHSVLWLDRGVARSLDKGFGAFEDWREQVWAAEAEAQHKLERKISAEARWAVEGISARRKRNQGRLRALHAARAKRASMIRRQGTAKMAFADDSQSGRLVIEAKGLAKSFGGKSIVNGFSLRVLRGDRVAIIGPNGVGKTTLLQLLLGQLEPDSGTVRLGAGLQIATFDQARSSLDPETTLWESLTGTQAMRVSGRADQLMVRGTPRHVVGYLKDFLFSEAQARAPVGSLSGGERARLLLARIMAQSSNLLVLDEPTNDLDMESLDVLQELLAEFSGTVLLVSHDRDFLDRVATVTVSMEGDGQTSVYAGGWTDYLAQRGVEREAAQARRVKGPTQPARQRAKPKQEGLSFTERHRFEELETVIELLAAEIGKLSEFLAEPDLYSRRPARFTKASEALAERQARLAAAEEEWLLLAERSES